MVSMITDVVHSDYSYYNLEMHLMYMQVKVLSCYGYNLNAGQYLQQ